MRAGSASGHILAGILFCAGLIPFAASQAAMANSEVYQPVANPAAVVTAGNARFTVLTPQLVRMEWAADARFEDHASFAFLNRRLPVPAFQARVSGHGAGRMLTIDTASLHLVYRGGVSGERFTAANLAITLRDAAEKAEWHPGMVDDGNLGGTTRTLDSVRGSDVKLEPGLVSRKGWTVVDDSQRPLFDSADFSMSEGEKSAWPWAMERPAGDRLDWYFFGYGHEYRKALGDFVKVAGRIPLPPRYAFGTWWSRYWAYSDQELNELVQGFRERNIPLDVFVIDMDWHLAAQGWKLDATGHTIRWTGYTWNRNLFPEPDLFLKSLHDRGLKVTLNLHPASGVQPFEQAYPEMARAMGQDPAEGKYVPFRITDRRFVDNYFKVLHHPLEKQGVDFWWLDWQQEPTTAIAGVSPTFWLNYLHFTDQEREGKRPLLFHRWGGLGNHRYEIGFSGDTVSVWESLAFQPRFTAQAANVGYAYWSHDIGGHMRGKVEPELYTRWIQFGAFSPILRTHTTKNPEAERRVWAYPEPYSDVMADTMRERYKWIPYIYTEARRTYDTGVAFIRPLYYEWPEAPEAYRSGNEYMFGDEVIAVPVVHPADPATKLATESVWLPEGEWIEQPTGKYMHGPARADRSFSLNQVPLYMRPGAIIPMQPPMLNTAAAPVDPLIVQVSPLNEGQRTEYAVYEDSSQGRGYMTGSSTTTGLHAERVGGRLTVTVDAVKGSYDGMLKQRAVRVELPADWPPSSVSVNGAKIPYVANGGRTAWWFTGNSLTTTIATAPFDTAQPMKIVVERDPEWVANAHLLDGFAGAMERLRQAYDDTNSTWPTDDLVAAMQTGERIAYRPETARAEVEKLPKLVRSALASLEAVRVEAVGDKAMSESAAREAEQRDKALTERLQRAITILRGVESLPGDALPK